MLEDIGLTIIHQGGGGDYEPLLYVYEILTNE